MIDYNSIFLISDPLANRPFRGQILNYSEANIDISRGETRIGNIVNVTYSMGESKPTNIIWTGNAHPLIFRESIVELLIENKITGWDTYNVQVFDKYNNELADKYFGIIITGRSGFVDYSRSENITKKIGMKDQPHFRGRFFNNDEWDGSDLFLENPDPIRGSCMYRYCTDKVFRLFKKYKIGNINFEKVTQNETWYFIKEKAT